MGSNEKLKSAMFTCFASVSGLTPRASAMELSCFFNFNGVLCGLVVMRGVTCSFGHMACFYFVFSWNLRRRCCWEFHFR
ncbi:hypothetical protein HPP92_019173 [Vanilla planifolia]|uniref:Uncharacterized protein n=1 Tax=Vanilla planifolia TaxID=51239 RepID=A0A835UJ32_VANPL|nr:hypothetical protein HPP92_019173 [Vanilla planifolia]